MCGLSRQLDINIRTSFSFFFIYQHFRLLRLQSCGDVRWERVSYNSAAFGTLHSASDLFYSLPGTLALPIRMNQTERAHLFDTEHRLEIYQYGRVCAAISKNCSNIFIDISIMDFFSPLFTRLPMK